MENKDYTLKIVFNNGPDEKPFKSRSHPPSHYSEKEVIGWAKYMREHMGWRYTCTFFKGEEEINLDEEDNHKDGEEET